MKNIRLSLTMILVAALTVVGAAGIALGFHEGGVANCDGCHTMHNFVDGVETGPVSGALLKGSDPSSVCLNCHHWDGTDFKSFYKVSTIDGSKFSPGGDFYWLTKTYTWSEFGTVHRSEGDDHGHNIIAPEFGYTQDVTLTQAPGGTYPSSNLACTSCHDPHGRKFNKTDPISISGSYGGAPAAGTEAGNFRLLGDINYDANGVIFSKPVPTAVTFFDGTEADNLHTDYGQGMAEWCTQCHTNISTGTKHPVDVNLGATLAGNYNKYVRTGQVDGTLATAYLALVPFERRSGTPLKSNSRTGPQTNDQVSCISCHRAHASAFQNATRWDMTTDFPVTNSHPKAGDGGLGANDVANSYYKRNMVGQFGNFQRSFCNKCHLLD